MSQPRLTPMLTVSEVAEHFRVSERQLRNLLKEAEAVVGTLGIAVGRRRRVYDDGDVRQLAEVLRCSRNSSDSHQAQALLHPALQFLSFVKLRCACYAHQMKQLRHLQSRHYPSKQPGNLQLNHYRLQYHPRLIFC